MSQQNNNSKILIAVLAIIVVLCICCSCAVSGAVLLNTTSSSERIVEGSTAEAGDLTWTVNSVKDKGKTLKGSESRYASQYYTPEDETASGKFIQINITIKNNGSEPNNIFGGIKLADAEGNTYDYESILSAWMTEKEGKYLSKLNPGEQATVSRIYDIPANVTELYLVAVDGLIPEEEVVKIKLNI